MTTLVAVMCVLAIIISDCPFSNRSSPDTSLLTSGERDSCGTSSFSNAGIVGLVVTSNADTPVTLVVPGFSLASVLGTTCKRTFVVRIVDRCLLGTGLKDFNELETALPVF